MIQQLKPTDKSTTKKKHEGRFRSFLMGRPVKGKVRCVWKAGSSFELSAEVSGVCARPGWKGPPARKAHREQRPGGPSRKALVDSNIENWGRLKWAHAKIRSTLFIVTLAVSHNLYQNTVQRTLPPSCKTSFFLCCCCCFFQVSCPGCAPPYELVPFFFSLL